ncbi:YbhB/YbcL family Raf kinase inhibitor-like protein [Pseudochelatococcus sp. B33]
MVFTLRSPVFADGEKLPPKYSRNGENVSPPLEWSDAPEGTKSFALVVEDPDVPSGLFRHWAVYDIDAQRTALPEGTTAGTRTENLGRGVNDFGNPHYDGPQPPPGHGVHRYHFRLVALDVETLGLGGKVPIDDVLKEVGKHVLGEARLMGTFESP